jgi:hypothetical protein
VRLFFLYLLAVAAFGDDFFETRVRPVLVDRCGGCHGENAASALRVDSRDALLKGGKRGPAVVVGDPGASLLMQAVSGAHTSLRMPPAGPLPAFEIAALETWIRDGVAWPAAVVVAPVRKLWAAEPLRPVTGSIDSHVRAKLPFPPNPKADRRTILRRLYLDLIGVPPAPAQAAAFMASGDVAVLVDTLLASPQFGERWGRHWLDVARFGEDDFTGTQPRPYPNAWRYRDWVIEQFNRDLPYDKFIKAQIGRLIEGSFSDWWIGIIWIGALVLRNYSTAAGARR